MEKPTFDYYTTTYKGAAIATEAHFERLTARAEEYISGIVTPGGFTSFPPGDTRVKDAICAVAEAWQQAEEKHGVTSERVGAWSRTYKEGTSNPAVLLYSAAYRHIAEAMRGAAWI